MPVYGYDGCHIAKISRSPIFEDFEFLLNLKNVIHAFLVKSQELSNDAQLLSQLSNYNLAFSACTRDHKPFNIYW